jgi:hypothetical protein
MADPKTSGVQRKDAERVLTKVLAHRVWTDLRRGWRFTNPSLGVLKVIRVDYVGLSELAADGARMDAASPVLGGLSLEKREEVLRQVLGAMLEGLSIDTEALDLTVLDGISQNSRSLLCDPWAIDRNETLRGQTAFMLYAPPKRETGQRDELTFIRGGARSRLARQINRASLIGTRLKAAMILVVPCLARELFLGRRVGGLALGLVDPQLEGDILDHNPDGLILPHEGMIALGQGGRQRVEQDLDTLGDSGPT